MRIILLFVLSISLLWSCSDTCKDVDCNEGACFEGECICFEGITGEKCNGRILDFYQGNWLGQLSCQPCNVEVVAPTLFSIIGTSDPLKSRLAFNGDTLNVRLGDTLGQSISGNELRVDPFFFDTISFDNTNLLDSMYIAAQFINDANTNSLNAKFFVYDSLSTNTLNVELIRQ